MSVRSGLHNIHSFITFTCTSLLALSLVLSTPLSAYALESTDGTTTASCTPDATSVGATRPNGADAATFTYNCAGYWENAYFIFTPATGAYTNKTEPTFTYNPLTAKYDYPVWVYNAPTNSYQSVSNTTDIPPVGATVVGAPVVVPAPASQTIANTGAGSNNQISSDGSGGAAAISYTGANSGNIIASTGRDAVTGNFTTVATVNNNLVSKAASGNVTLSQNTTAGNASTGNATAMANIVNLLQSTANSLGHDGNVVTFVANINGDVNGDLLLNPASLASIQPAGSQPIGTTDLTINNQTGATINNNLKLNATSGDATTSQNTTAGNATTGNAQAVANIVNIIDSAVSSGKSFFGIININGNLNGDILLPPNLVDQLLAANVPTVSIDTTGAGSNNGITNTGAKTTDVTNNNNAGITNTVKASALSGNATSTDNTAAGKTSTGSAATNITAFNLTGSSVIGNNALLVFVNVLGTWVGLIVNAPAGANAAELGGGITQNSPIANDTTTVNNNTDHQINNKIDVVAKSGDASQTQNTTAGNATTGDAKVAVNLLNISHSTLSLSNWFGLLFINVFGSWHGSFGVNTAYGDPIVPTAGAAASFTPTTSAPAATNNTYHIFHFVPRTPNVSRPVAYSQTPASQAGISTDNNSSLPKASGAVLSAHTIKKVAVAPTAPQTNRSAIVRSAVIISLFMSFFLAKDAISSYRRRHTQ